MPMVPALGMLRPEFKGDKTGYISKFEASLHCIVRHCLTKQTATKPEHKSNNKPGKISNG